MHRLPHAETAFLKGTPALELARESEVSDLIVIGSRDYGPSGAVILGGVGGRVMQTAVCPAVVVPHAAAAPLADLVQRCGELLIDSAV